MELKKNQKENKSIFQNFDKIKPHFNAKIAFQYNYRNVRLFRNLQKPLE